MCNRFQSFGCAFVFWYFFLTTYTTYAWTTPRLWRDSSKLYIPKRLRATMDWHGGGYGTSGYRASKPAPSARARRHAGQPSFPEQRTHTSHKPHIDMVLGLGVLSFGCTPTSRLPRLVPHIEELSLAPQHAHPSSPNTKPEAAHPKANCKTASRHIHTCPHARPGS